MSGKKKEFTAVIKCGHCQNSAPMEVIAKASDVRDYTDDASGESWEAGTVYELSQCPACSSVTLRSFGWHSGYMDGSEIEYRTLYPTSSKALRGLPTKIDKAYEAAQRLRNIDANAYGVLLGRVLEFVCEDRSSTGKTLDQRLKSLAEKNEIPSKLVDVAAGVRRLRNIGAHASLGELTPAEVPVLDDLTRAVLEYVYSAPFLAKEAEDRLAKLKIDAPDEDASESEAE
ncbi:MAG: DUF4145 domain-containing protein [Candidatus Sulfotelmatobacter sp.]